MTEESAIPDTLIEPPSQAQIERVSVRPRITNAPPNAEPRRLRLWLMLVLVVGMLALSMAGFATWSWLRSLPLFSRESATPPPAITTLQVGRTVTYADLAFTVVSVQYATSFGDDAIHAGPAMARLNMQVTNQTKGVIGLVYYDIARLLVPGKVPIAPSNAQLAATVQPVSSVRGWLDFPVPLGIQLSSLKLQLGSAALNETLVILPVSGAFHPEQYASHHSLQSLVIYYSFEGNTLTYHLNSIDVRYSYNGGEVQTGKQFYVLNFTVDNPNGSDVSPGFGYDYIRLVIDGTNLPPIDNTLPYTFKAGAHSVGGHVTFEALAGMTSLTIAFLLQLVEGQENYQVNL